MSIMAIGKHVIVYSICVGMPNVISVFLCWGLFALGWGMWSICITFVVAQMLVSAIRVALGRWLVGYEPKYWLRHVFVPVVLLSVCCLFVGHISQRFLGPSFVRIVVTTTLVESLLLPMAWFIVLGGSEREYIVAKLRQKRRRDI